MKRWFRAAILFAWRLQAQDPPTPEALDQARVLESLPPSLIAECNTCRRTNIQRLRSGQTPISTVEMVTCEFKSPPTDACGICAKKMCAASPAPAATPPAPSGAIPSIPAPPSIPPIPRAPSIPTPPADAQATLPPVPTPPAATTLPPETPTPPLGTPTPSKLPYSGPKSGIINWSGVVEKGGSFTIEGERALNGKVLYGGLPGVPILVDFNSEEFAIAEAPGLRNNWSRLTMRSLRRRHTVVTIKWTVLE